MDEATSSELCALLSTSQMPPELQLVDLAIAENGAADQGVADLHEPIYAQQLCAALMSVHCPEPVTFVAYGPTCLALPPVALSMRSQHRRVRSYVLIDPRLPASSDTWPDCPVSVVYANSDGRVLGCPSLRLGVGGVATSRRMRCSGFSAVPEGPHRGSRPLTNIHGVPAPHR